MPIQRVMHGLPMEEIPARCVARIELPAGFRSDRLILAQACGVELVGALDSDDKPVGIHKLYAHEYRFYEDVGLSPELSPQGALVRTLVFTTSARDTLQGGVFGWSHEP